MDIYLCFALIGAAWYIVMLQAELRRTKDEYECMISAIIEVAEKKRIDERR